MTLKLAAALLLATGLCGPAIAASFGMTNAAVAVPASNVISIHDNHVICQRDPNTRLTHRHPSPGVTRACKPLEKRIDGVKQRRPCAIGEEMRISRCYCDYRVVIEPRVGHVCKAK